MREGPPELFEAVERGEISLHAAVKQLDGAEPPARQFARRWRALMRAVEAVAKLGLPPAELLDEPEVRQALNQQVNSLRGYLDSLKAQIAAEPPDD
jgi:hypothetical protein